MQSEQLNELANALAQAQSEFTAIPKGDTNPFFKSKYAGLPDVVLTASPILARNGLSVSQFISTDQAGNDTLITYLMHESGQFIANAMRMHLVKFDPQSQGSATTYARRYAYMAALGLVADEDDDGNRATHQAQQSAEPVRRAAPRPAPSPVDNEDIQLIIDAAAISDNQFLIDLAAKYQQYGKLTERQLAAGVPQAMKILTESKKSQTAEIPNEDGEYQW